jgi:hypothetical protein
VILVLNYIRIKKNQFQFLEKKFSIKEPSISTFKKFFKKRTCDFHERTGEESMGFWPVIFSFFQF